jgi:hypothetical protein
MWASGGLFFSSNIPGSSTGPGTAQLWRSDDHGVTWQQVWEREASLVSSSMLVGEAPHLAAIASDGTFIADGSSFYTSRDRGQTWAESPFPRAYRFRYVTGNGNGVSFDDNDVPQFDPDDLTVSVKSFHMWHDYGAGAAFAQVTPIVPTPDMGDQRVDLEQVLPTLSMDDQSYVWWYAGSPTQAIWRSRRPID